MGLAFTTPAAYIVDLTVTNAYLQAKKGQGCGGLVSFSVLALVGIVILIMGFAVANMDFAQAVSLWNRITCKKPEVLAPGEEKADRPLISAEQKEQETPTAVDGGFVVIQREE